jgi:hypothetical protein
MGVGLHGDDADGSGYLELEVGIGGDGHTLHVTWLPNVDMVRSGEVDHFNSEHLSAVIACVSEGDR